MLTKKKQKVAIIMGSQSDYTTMKYCKKVLKLLTKSNNKIEIDNTKDVIKIFL